MKKISILFQKELQSYFNTPIGYIFLALYLILVNFLFFYGLGQNSFWDFKIASMDQFFVWVPIVFIIFIPSITMRVWSEEEKSGTLEILLTLPVSFWELILSKFLASWAFLTLGICLTIFAPITISVFGNLEWGVVLVSYFGVILFGGAYVSLGVLISSLAKDQITSFLVSLMVFLGLFLLGYEPLLQFFKEPFVTILSFLSVSHHFESFRLGILDIREIFYFLSLMLTALSLNFLVLVSKR